MNDKPSTLEGGCLCGAVRYSVCTPALEASYCHCRLCQKASGAPVVAWAEFPLQAVNFTKGNVQWRRSSPNGERGFCPECGTQITFRHERKKESQIDIATTTLDEPSAIPPREHIWLESAQSWLVIDDDLPRYAQERTD